MAEQIVGSSLSAPGFLGVNTQDAMTNIESGYASRASNCVIDKFGRIGARKGWSAQHEANTDLSTENITSIHELIDNDGQSHVIAAGNGNLYKLSGGTLTTLSYGGGGTAPTISADNWQMAPLNGVLYLYQYDYDPLVFDPAVSTTEYRRVSEKSGYLGTAAKNNCVISAYGRTWSANNSSSKSIIQFSDLQAGQVLTTGTAGTLDVSEVWPAGADEIIALAAHNNFLYVFGRRQILIYRDATDPSLMSLSDAISGVGCCARDSVVVVGTDIFFLSDSGVRSLARVIQEKSAPFRDISANVRDDLVNDLIQENVDNIKAVYSDQYAFYLISFPSSSTVYCFDTRKALQEGQLRVTTWDMAPRALAVTRAKDVLFGFAGIIGAYGTNLDNTDTYRFEYFTNFFDLGQPSVIKILKKVGFTIIGGAGAGVVLKYGFDYTNNYNARTVELAQTTVSEFGIAEYGIAEYTAGIVFDNQKIQVGGSGNVIQVGIETDIDSFDISVQRLDVFCKIGRTR